ncbi:NAD-dependent succinate-semialdehyde dehydrogenase [Cellulophaga baltica]|uniref:NAD-dependent succinate-semialdehyde dehydrogenase n=1 Tax=Cellulophaga TaxID=104264 RepID=UPI001C07EDC8|nr:MULTISPECIES: NAD-dependent succinate-semialdehyde dehydrogenase [Cellulophaga]MBU2997845.1 NAD-dependent succinate-semialdehyde dehydrogenase [Cellulophaga baltica]MDO6769244.1 NAD-dependent succinate-semialdehyde dehydrogenase [Cellulophaga sp. 1_MG-2023]
MNSHVKHSPIKTVNPFTNKIEKEFDVMTSEQVAKIIDNADVAFKSWKNTPFSKRATIIRKVASIMRERKETLGKLATIEMGKLLAESIYEVELSANIFDYYANNAAEFLADKPLDVKHGEAFLSYEPIGVILSVQPWNFPYYQITRSAASNLMAGNTMVLKHASNVPQCAQIMEDIFKEAGLPNGVYTNLFVPGRSVSAIVSNPKIKAVTLTGSKPAGSSITAAAGENVKKSTLELGGSDPFIVMADADVQEAVDVAVSGRMWNAGQVCVSPKRVIVPKSLYNEFLDKTKKAFANLVVGDPMDAATNVAPLSSEQAAVDVQKQVQKAAEQGAAVRIGGNRVDREGAFLEPTLITDITPEMDAYFEEIFGPVFMLYQYDTIDEAIEIANATEFGLGGSVFGKDTKKAVEVARKIDTGMVYINHVTGIAPELPFGGTKESGFGREQSPAGIYEFTNAKLIRTTSSDKAY